MVVVGGSQRVLLIHPRNPISNSKPSALHVGQEEVGRGDKAKWWSVWALWFWLPSWAALGQTCGLSDSHFSS